MAARKSKTAKSEPKGQIKISQNNPFWTHLPEGTKSLSFTKDMARKLLQQFINIPIKDFKLVSDDGAEELEILF